MPPTIKLTEQETEAFRMKRGASEYRRLVIDLYWRGLRLALANGCKVPILAADGEQLDAVG